MSFRALRARTTLATAFAVTAALIAPTSSGAAAAAPGSPGADTVDVSGTVLVIPGEDGGRDRYSLLLPSGRTIALADGFTAEPLSRFVGSVAVPGAGRGTTLSGALRASALRRAATSAVPLRVVDARVAEPAPSPGPTNHSTYVAKVTNFGTIGLTDAQILATITASQAYWVRESSGQIPAWTTVSGVAAITAGAGSVANGCGLGAGGVDFDAIAANVGAQAYPGVDFSGASPNHLVIVVPDGCGDPTTGRARLGTSFASGGPAIIQSQPPAQARSTLDHELGHNVGLQHANNGVAEYGDVFEVMGADSGTWATPTLGTVYRWEQGILAAGEWADASAGLGSTVLQPRSAASGLRGVVFINPDNGRRYFVDYRNGAGTDAGTCYAAGTTACNYGGTTGTYGQTYAPGITVERENDVSGAFVESVTGGDGSLQSGESWAPATGRVTVRATAANAVSVTIAPPSGTVAGGAAATGAPVALRDVTATASGFSPAPAGYRYQWLLNGTPVPGAEDATFRPTTAMAGGALTVAVTAYAPRLAPATVTSAAQTVAPAVWYANGTRRYPEITGTTRVGQTLTALGLDWVDYYGRKPADFAPTYQWTRSGATIAGATASTYRLTSKDLGKTIQVIESPRAAGFTTTSFGRSVSTAKVTQGRLVTKRPKIKGKASVGKVVKATTPGWTTATKFRYQWFLGKKAIRGATRKKLRVSRAMRHKVLVVKVTGKKTGYKKATEKSRSKKVR